MKPAVLTLFLLLSNAFFSTGSDLFRKGESFFVADKPQDALPLLEAALDEDPTNEKVYLYLGIVYQQLGEGEKAIAVLTKGLNVSSEYKDLFYYNMANNYFTRKEYTFAEGMYSSALAANRTLSAAYLNRANARLALENYEGALADYTLFLQLKPEDAQRSRIEAVIGLLRQALEEKERKHQEELAKQKALMNDVLNSLSNAGDAAKNLSVDAIKIKEELVDVDIKE